MARPQKQTVDYYPHIAKAGKTIFILERKYGNDGYAVFHKLLETLCTSDGHVIDYGNPSEREFLVAKTSVSEEKLTEIIEMLVQLGKIDAILWVEKKIWYQNLVDSVADAYKKRKAEIPKKPVSGTGNHRTEEFLPPETQHSEVSGTGNPQTKLKESKVYIKEKKVSVPETPCDYFSDFWEEYPRKDARLKAEKAWSKLKVDDDLMQKIMNGLYCAMNSPTWKKDGGQFVPHASTWINGKRWQDESLQRYKPVSGGDIPWSTTPP